MVVVVVVMVVVACKCSLFLVAADEMSESRCVFPHIQCVSGLFFSWCFCDWPVVVAMLTVVVVVLTVESCIYLKPLHHLGTFHNIYYLLCGHYYHHTGIALLANVATGHACKCLLFVVTAREVKESRRLFPRIRSVPGTIFSLLMHLRTSGLVESIACCSIVDSH